MEASGNDLLVLAQVLHNNPTLYVKDGRKLNVMIHDKGDVKDLDEALRTCPNIRMHIGFIFSSVNRSDLPVLAQVLASNHITCDKVQQV